MSFFTFLLEYSGGTYLSQIAASSPDNAFVIGARNLNFRDISDFDKEAKESLIVQMETDSIAPVDGLSNVWCNTATLNGNLAFVHIVQTEIVPQKPR